MFECHVMEARFSADDNGRDATVTSTFVVMVIVCHMYVVIMLYVCHVYVIFMSYPVHPNQT